MRLLPWMHSVKAQVGMRVQNLGTRNPTSNQRLESSPSHASTLASPLERAIPPGARGIDNVRRPHGSALASPAEPSFAIKI
jgi:hypothetical protein